MERVSKELHRRTRVATLFPNEASLFRLVSAQPCLTAILDAAERIPLTLTRLGS